MFLQEWFALFLLLKGLAIGCLGSVYWLVGETEAATVLLTLAFCYVSAAWAIERRMP